MDQSEGRVRINMQHIAIQEVKVGRQAPQEVQSLAGVVDSSQLDSPELEELERIKLLQRKTEHAREGEMLKLKEKVYQMKDEVAFAQRQSRLSLARAVRAEIQADKVAVLEQQLSQTKATLEEQIQMKDQVLAVAVRQFNRAYSDMQQGLLMRDQAIATLRKQMQISLECQTEVNKQSMMSAQQQFDHMKATLQHRIKVEEQARIALERQIQAKEREKAELVQQLCQKEEQIKTLQQRCEVSAAILHFQGKATQFLCPPDQQTTTIQKDTDSHNLDALVGLHAPTSKMQAERSPQVSQVSFQGQMASLHEDRKETKMREEELRQVREEHEAELSRLLKESAVRQQELEFQLKAQIRAKCDEISNLQIQAQQKLKEKDAQSAAISSESKNRIEMLTDEMQKLTNQNGELEARLEEVKFFRDVYSQESDQLRADLMDKIAEIDSLRKGQADMVPESNFSLTLPADGSGKVESKHQYVQTETVDLSNHQEQTKCTQHRQSTVDMQGTEVIAQKTFTLTKEADNLNFEAYEFLEGSLPAKVSETQLKVQVSLSGQLQRPSNSELLCTVIIHFRSPQSIYIQPVQSVLEQTKLGQAQARLQEQQHSKSLACTETVCQTEQEQEGEVVEQCCAQLFIQKLVSVWKLDFVVTKNHESCSTVVRKKYSSHCQEQFSFSFSFKQDSISLQIPKDGLQLGGWNITPLYDSKIKKQEVNCFSSGKRIPKCELLLQWDQDTPPACLQCQIGLTGTCDHNYFLLCVNPGVTLSDPSQEPTVKGFVQDKDEAISIDTLADITSYLHPLDKTAVFNLGLVLGLDYNRLKPMQDSPHFLEDMLAGWLQRMDQVLRTGFPTWKRLVKALEDPRVGQNGVASKIKQDNLCN